MTEMKEVVDYTQRKRKENRGGAKNIEQNQIDDIKTKMSVGNGGKKDHA